jgi:hypothetical protein
MGGAYKFNGRALPRHDLPAKYASKMSNTLVKKRAYGDVLGA